MLEMRAMRKTRSLLAVDDNHPKYLISMDKLRAGNHEGIQCQYLPGWLLAQE